jgi:hypothetical protein
VLAEIPVAASLGVELFYIDAGWCAGSCKNGSGNWFAGVGNWGREDRVKYPGGLAEISKKVHAAGMKFGLWFAPQVCDSRLIGSVVPLECAAQCNGKEITLAVSGWSRITQICLGNPAAHNEAWVIRCGEIEHAKDPALLDTLVRSRMIGLFGIGTLSGRLSERASLYPKEVLDALKRNIDAYKQYRHLLQEDVYHILPPSSNDHAWDAVQFCKRDGSESVLIVFRSNSPDAEKVLPLRGLTVDATNDAKSYNEGPPHALSGQNLASGLKINLPRPEMSEILHLKRRFLPDK